MAFSSTKMYEVASKAYGSSGNPGGATSSPSFAESFVPKMTCSTSEFVTQEIMRIIVFLLTSKSLEGNMVLHNIIFVTCTSEFHTENT